MPDEPQLPIAPPHWRDDPDARCIGCDAQWQAEPPYEAIDPSYTGLIDALMEHCEYDGQNYMLHKADCPWLKMMNQHTEER